MKTTVAYDLITQKIIESMEAGEIPWRKPWTAGPRNLFTGKAYRGVNTWLLSMVATSTPLFATFNQIKQHGGMVSKGSKSSPIFFFTKFNKTVVDEKTEEKRLSIPVLRTYNVFILEQMEGIDASQFVDPAVDFQPNLSADTLIEAFLTAENLSLSFDGGDRAFYAPSLDAISLPKRETFHGAGPYYSTVFHEIGHATGHEKRLKRDGVASNRPHGRGEVYSFEELVAELTSSYLCALTGIDNEMETEQRAAYIQSWLKVLKNDKAIIWKASSHAQKAVDYILLKANLKLEEESEAVPF